MRTVTAVSRVAGALMLATGARSRTTLNQGLDGSHRTKRNEVIVGL